MGLIKKAGTRAVSHPLPEPVTHDDRSGLISATRNELAQPERASTPLAPPSQPLGVGTILQGRYQIVDLIGSGGMSLVYRGRDLRFKEVDRSCAIKEMTFITPDAQARQLNLTSFEREASLLATLRHPAIPRIYDVFTEHGRVYLVLELIPGRDLGTLLEASQGPFDVHRVVHWAVQICDLLDYLHTHQPTMIVFRDMKPSNIILSADERIVLIDFGIARHLTYGDQKGTMVGTEGYAPPEQYRGIAEPTGDIYALGATLHHLLTAIDPRFETPFTFHERPIRQINTTVSQELEAVIMKALAYEREARWQSAEAMKQALLGLSATGSLPALPVQTEETKLSWSFQCGDEIRSSPAVAGGMVFVGAYDTYLYALDAHHGGLCWKYATAGGLSSSPTVWQDTVIIGSEDGLLYCVDRHRGSLRWIFRTAGPIRSSPRVADRMVVVGSDDQHIYAIDGMRGSLIWKQRTWEPVRSSAYIHDQLIFIGGDDGYIYALDVRSGSVRWRQRTQQSVRSSPAYADGLVVVGSLDQQIYALNAENGWIVWRVRTGHYVNSSPSIAGSRVFVGGVDGMLYALDLKSGRLVWKYAVGAQITSSPYIEAGRVYVGAVDGRVYCVDADRGSLIWSHQTAGAIVSSPIVVDRTLYIGSMDHYLYALKV